MRAEVMAQWSKHLPEDQNLDLHLHVHAWWVWQLSYNSSPGRQGQSPRRNLARLAIWVGWALGLVDRSRLSE